MDVRLPAPRSMETLRKNYPREAKYYKPGSKAGKRPQLVWERLWTTTNGEYGSKQFIETRPRTKGPLRDNLWKNRRSDTTYREYGQSKTKDPTTVTPQIVPQSQIITVSQEKEHSSVLCLADADHGGDFGTSKDTNPSFSRNSFIRARPACSSPCS